MVINVKAVVCTKYAAGSALYPELIFQCCNYFLFIFSPAYGKGMRLEPLQCRQYEVDAGYHDKLD